MIIIIIVLLMLLKCHLCNNYVIEPLCGPRHPLGTCYKFYEIYLHPVRGLIKSPITHVSGPHWFRIWRVKRVTFDVFDKLFRTWFDPPLTKPIYTLECCKEIIRRALTHAMDPVHPPDSHQTARPTTCSVTLIVAIRNHSHDRWIFF